MPSPIQSYLEELRRRLRGQPFLARRVIEEIADHLEEGAAAARREGMSALEAEAEAVRRLGPVDRYLDAFPGILAPLRHLFLFGTVVTALVAMWLLFVIVVVLPARDPGQVAFWTWIQAVLGIYILLCIISLLRGVCARWLSTALLLLSAASIGAGLYGVLTELRVAQTGGHFEGYLVLLGLVLVGQGGVALAYTLLSLRAARRLRRS